MMTKIKPLNKLVKKARALRDSHKERHRPSGFGFALADSINYLDAGHWDAVTANNSLFLKPSTCGFLSKQGLTTCANVTLSFFEVAHRWLPLRRKASRFHFRA